MCNSRRPLPPFLPLSAILMLPSLLSPLFSWLLSPLCIQFPVFRPSIHVLRPLFLLLVPASSSLVYCVLPHFLVSYNRAQSKQPTTECVSPQLVAALEVLAEGTTGEMPLTDFGLAPSGRELQQGRVYEPGIVEEGDDVAETAGQWHRHESAHQEGTSDVDYVSVGSWGQSTPSQDHGHHLHGLCKDSASPYRREIPIASVHRPPDDAAVHVPHFGAPGTHHIREVTSQCTLHIPYRSQSPSANP